MRRASRTTGNDRASIKGLVARLIPADSAPKRAGEAEKELIRLANPACINLLLPVLVRNYPPSQAADSVIRVIHGLNASKKACRYLVGKLKDRRWRTRAAAAAALESFPDLYAASALATASKDRNDDAAIMAIHSLSVLSLAHPKLKKTVYNVYRNAIRRSSHGVRGAAFEGISHMADIRCDRLMALAVKDPHPQIRQMSAWWLQGKKRIKA